MRPSIWQIGEVLDDGTTVTVTGWGLGLCMRCCACHCDVDTGNLKIAAYRSTGELGLVKNRLCSCCEPWKAEELAAILADLDFITDPTSVVVG